MEGNLPDKEEEKEEEETGIGVEILKKKNCIE